MKLQMHARRANWLAACAALALSMWVCGACAADAARIDESELSAAGFKVLVAANQKQQEWVKTLTPGQMRPMQRTGKKYFIYPAAAGNQIYVGGPQEYAALQRLHPPTGPSTLDAAIKGNAYRSKQNEVMQKATAQDLTDPFLGATWGDLGW